MKNKTKKYKNNNKTRSKKGGIIFKEAPDVAFYTFLINSNITYVSEGTFGITFKATLKPGIKSPYISIQDISGNSYGNLVNTLLIKMSFIHFKNKGETEKDITIDMPSFHIDMASVEEQDFKDEINTQVDIFFKTISYLQPICPSIVFSNIYTNTHEIGTLLQVMIRNSGDRKTNNILKEIYELVKDGEITSYGIIGMEFAQNYVLLSKLKDSPNFNGYVMMTIYILLQLAVQTGYNHGDYHTGNIFINPDNENYFKNFKGSPLLIDYGLAYKIPPNILDEIKELYKEERYIDAMSKICDLNRKDNLNMRMYNNYYGYVCGTFNSVINKPAPGFSNNINDIIKRIVKKREEAIDMNVKIFEKKHDNNPEVYPLLPLSNEVKNKMYNGMIGGKKRKRNIKIKKKTKKR